MTTALLITCPLSKGRNALAASLAATYASFALTVFHVFPVLHIAACSGRHAFSRSVFHLLTALVFALAGTLFTLERRLRTSSLKTTSEPFD